MFVDVVGAGAITVDVPAIERAWAAAFVPSGGGHGRRVLGARTRLGAIHRRRGPAVLPHPQPGARRDSMHVIEQVLSEKAAF
jgi:hypothetical protein